MWLESTVHIDWSPVITHVFLLHASARDDHDVDEDPSDGHRDEDEAEDVDGGNASLTFSDDPLSPRSVRHTGATTALT